MSNKNKLGFWSIVLLGINAIIGSGIFGLPNKAYGIMGPSSILVILFDMFLAVSIALCFAEAAGRFKENGGPYIYAKEAFGDFVGFEVGFMKWAIGIIAWAAMAAFFCDTLAKVVPAVSEGPGRIAIILLVLVGLGIVNIMGVKTSKILNNMITIGKLIPLLAFVCIGIFFIKGANFEPFVVISEGQTVTDSFVAASVLMFYAFTGFESIAVAAEDMENPEKNLPKAIAVVMTIVSVMYICVLASCIGILGPDVALTKTPVADAAGRILGPAGAIFITAGTIISVGGINIAASFLTPRSGVAMAETGLLPKFIAKTNKQGAPYVAIIITVVLAAFLALTGSFAKLAAISVISRFAQYIPTCLSIPVFRKKYADQELSFKLPFGSLIPMVATLTSFWLLYKAGVQSPEKIIWGLGGLAVGIPVYFYMTKIYNKNDETHIA